MSVAVTLHVKFVEDAVPIDADLNMALPVVASFVYTKLFSANNTFVKLFNAACLSFTSF